MQEKEKAAGKEGTRYEMGQVTGAEQGHEDDTMDVTLHRVTRSQSRRCVTHTQVLACGECIRSFPMTPPAKKKNPPNFLERRGKSKCLGDLQKDGQVFAGSILILPCPGPKVKCLF